MSSLPSSEEVRISASCESSPSLSSSYRRRRLVACAACGAVLALVIGLSVGLTGKNPAAIVSDGYATLTGGKRVDPPEDDRGGIAITSPAFAYGDAIPADYTSDGEDVSPPIRWSTEAGGTSGLPDGTRSIMILMEDRDYPNPESPAPYPWVHWVAYDINPNLGGLPEALPRASEVKDVMVGGTGEPVSAGADIAIASPSSSGPSTVTFASGPMRQGSTSWGDDAGYRGPDPPPGHGPHRYYFRVLALDDTVHDKIPAVQSKAYITYDDVLDVVEGDGAKATILGYGMIMGTYG